MTKKFRAPGEGTYRNGSFRWLPLKYSTDTYHYFVWLFWTRRVWRGH